MVQISDISVTKRRIDNSMLKISNLAVLTALLLTISASFSYAAPERYKIITEESYYVISPENKDKFLEIYRDKLYPFWSEMQKRGIIVDEFKLYTQRLHTLDPHWTYKTVVRFKDYDSIDKWLALRDEVYDKLFPGEGGYAGPRKQIDLITVQHWDEFIRELPLSKKN